MQLNDQANDEQRQLLLPFITRLACADTPEVEMVREVYIASRLRWRQSFQERLATLEGALTIGRQADTLALDEVGTRLNGERQRAVSRTSVDEHPLLATVHAWLPGVS